MATLRANRIPYTQGFSVKSAVTGAAAKTTETDLANAVLLYTAPSDAPAFCTELTVKPRQTCTAVRLKVYIVHAASSTVAHPKRSRLQLAATINETTIDQEVDFGWSDTTKLKLAPGDAIYVAQGATASSNFDWVGHFEEFQAVT
jgi:hypothetical protein